MRKTDSFRDCVKSGGFWLKNDFFGEKNEKKFGKIKFSSFHPKARDAFPKNWLNCVGGYLFLFGMRGIR